MGQNQATELDDEISFADLLRWMNAQKRPPGAKKTVLRHRQVREQLERLGLRFYQKVPGGKLWTRLSDLARHAPLIADKMQGQHQQAAEA